MKTRNPIGNEDYQYTECKRCGFPCKLDRDRIRPGNGQTYSEITHTQDQAPYDSTISYGCPQCGRGEYNKPIRR